jgi:hypothetical protein
MDIDWKTVGRKLAHVGLPLLGTALGGPAGGAAGALIASVLGKDPSAITTDDVTAAIVNPELMVKFREIESNHEIRLQELILQGEQMRFQDVASARKREVDTTEATGKRDINLYVLAWTVVVLFFALVGTLMFIDLGVNTGPVNQLFGAIAVGFGTVLQYFFGSSKSSSDKTALLAVNKPAV